MSKHTKGPWKQTELIIEDVTSFPYYEITNATGTDGVYWIAQVNAHCKAFPEQQSEANAKLIADCPLMYDYIAKQTDEEAKRIIARHA